MKINLLKVYTKQVNNTLKSVHPNNNLFKPSVYKKVTHT